MSDQKQHSVKPELQVRPCDMADHGRSAIPLVENIVHPHPQGLVPADRQVRHVLQALYKEKVAGKHD